MCCGRGGACSSYECVTGGPGSERMKWVTEWASGERTGHKNKIGMFSELAETAAGVNGTRVRARACGEGADEWPWPMAGGERRRACAVRRTCCRPRAREESAGTRHGVRGCLVVGRAAPPSAAVRALARVSLAGRSRVDTPPVARAQSWLQPPWPVLLVPPSVAVDITAARIRLAYRSRWYRYCRHECRWHFRLAMPWPLDSASCTFHHIIKTIL